MDISKDTAKLIIDELSTVIKENLNFINNNGIIIYSTDPNRIGTFHEAAFKSKNEKRTIIVKSDDEYKGAKRGINLPVFFENRIVGVIGITGEYEEIRKYGSIIKKMTEILILEKYVEKSKLKKKEEIKYYLEGLIYNSVNEGYQEVREFDKKKRLCVGKNQISHISIEHSKNIEKILDKNLNYIDCIYSIFFNDIIILYFIDDLSKIRESLGKITLEIKKVTNYNIDFGVSGMYKNILKSKENYENSLIALQWGSIFKKESNLFIYDDLDLEILFSNINSDRIKKYRNIVLKNLKENQIEDFKKLINSYIKNNGSLTKISSDLYIHKNTVQYRLNKINETTGYNPRELSDLIRLYLAFILE